ncbi:MAG: aminodeoxychorismate lyase [Gammaproteobacteria bacterium]|jgi:4-amino-4-deoxychorismate lyase|nr:aminodeoxychorismate lyase [Chromatiales bacterium]MDP7296879.1 aminodeoxychorismate lyase [Gammaproteobacteria bacterium]
MPVKMHNWLIDGVAGDRIAVDDRGFTYADGLFETIAVRDGQLRFFDYHLDRLLNGARQLNIPAPERELFADEAGDLVKESEYATLKIILTRGTGHRGYAPPVTATSSRLLGLLPGVPPARTKYIDGIVVRHCSTSIGHSPATAGLKTLGRLEQVLARAEWEDTAITEGLMSTTDGYVICGTMSNLFLVRHGVLVTPDLTTCGINGVMRRIVLERAARIGLQWRAEAVPRDHLGAADELFVTNSLIGLWPVRRIADRTYPVGAVTRSLMAELAGAGISECAGP